MFDIFPQHLLTTRTTVRMKREAAAFFVCNKEKNGVTSHPSGRPLTAVGWNIDFFSFKQGSTIEVKGPNHECPCDENNFLLFGLKCHYLCMDFLMDCKIFYLPFSLALMTTLFQICPSFRVDERIQYFQFSLFSFSLFALY